MLSSASMISAMLMTYIMALKIMESTPKIMAMMPQMRPVFASEGSCPSKLFAVEALLIAIIPRMMPIKGQQISEIISPTIPSVWEEEADWFACIAVLSIGVTGV